LNKAVFLDRDGVINIERGEHTFRIAEFEFVDEIFESLKILQQKGYLLIIITNQSGIAKGLYNFEDLKIVHNYMLEKFSEHGVQITDIYFCPHFTELGKCICRKPDSLMLEKAIARYQINPSASYFIGDKKRDIDAGEKCSVPVFLIEPNTSILKICEKI